MRQQITIPTTGQFVVVWEDNGVVWSDTLKWNEKEKSLLGYYCEREGEFMYGVDADYYTDLKGAIYILE